LRKATEGQAKLKNMKTLEELFSGDRSNINRSELYLLILKKIFNKDEPYLKEILDKLGDKKGKLEKFAHFYYYICQPYANDGNVREELRLIGITSLIEGMMQEIEYKDFFQWFESTYKVNKIEDYLKIKEEYLEQFGATRRIKSYFESYILEGDRDSLLECIKPFTNQNGFVRFNSIDKIAQFLYSMRSEFVHIARMHSLCPEDCHLAAICVHGKPYKVNIKISEFMKIFERSFINFWEKKAGVIN